jgi:hypothetical protein
MPDENRDSILSYQTAVPGSKHHRAAGIVMLVWACVALLAALPLAAIALFAVVLVFAAGPVDLCTTVAVLLMTGPVAYGLVRSGVYLTQLSRAFFSHEPPELGSMIGSIKFLESGAYVVGFMVCILLALASLRAAVLGSPLFFVLAVGLSLTRILLRRMYDA